jgi:hypothetical protein
MRAPAPKVWRTIGRVAAIALAGAPVAACSDAASLDRAVARAEALGQSCEHHFQLREAHGRMVTDPGVVDLYWGSWWTASDEGKGARDAVDAAWSALAIDPRFYAPLQEYAPAGRPIAGEWLGSFTGYDALAPGVALTAAAVEAELARGIASHELPGRTDAREPIYVVYLPRDVRGPVLESGVEYLAYHDHFTPPGSDAPVAYAIVLFEPGDVPGMTLAAAHELDESITNPFDDGWRDLEKNARGAHEELADICNSVPARIDDLTVQEVWSQKKCACGFFSR